MQLISHLTRDGRQPAETPSGVVGSHRKRGVKRLEKRIPYSLYKTGYDKFPSKNYDSKTKTILVDLPPIKRRVWPKDWNRIGGNSFLTPNGCRVYFWNTGLAQNYLVERYVGPFCRRSKTIPASIDAYDTVLQTVQEFGDTQTSTS